MNKGVTLLFLLAFGVGSMGQVFAQTGFSGNKSKHESATLSPIPLNQIDKTDIHQRHSEAQVKESSTIAKKVVKSAAKKLGKQKTDVQKKCTWRGQCYEGKPLPKDKIVPKSASEPITKP